MKPAVERAKRFYEQLPGMSAQELDLVLSMLKKKHAEVAEERRSTVHIERKFRLLTAELLIAHQMKHVGTPPAQSTYYKEPRGLQSSMMFLVWYATGFRQLGRPEDVRGIKSLEASTRVIRDLKYPSG